MEKLINSFATKNASWLSATSMFLALAIGIFSTALMGLDLNLVSTSIFLIITTIELGITVLNLSHGMFRLTNNKTALLITYSAIVFGFAFNSLLIYGAYNANVFAPQLAFLFWITYMGGNAARIFFGFIASAMIHTTKEALQTGISYFEQQLKLKELSTQSDITFKKQLHTIRQLELEAAKELGENQPKKLAAHEKIAGAAGAVIGKIAGAKGVMGSAFNENFSAAKQRKPTENLENPTENPRKPSENPSEKKSPYPITEIKAVFFKQDESISVMFEDETLIFNATNLKSLKSNFDMRKNKNHEKYNADYALFLQFVLENIPEKTETGSATRLISAQQINEFLFRQEADDNSATD